MRAVKRLEPISCGSENEINPVTNLASAAADGSRMTLILAFPASRKVVDRLASASSQPKKRRTSGRDLSTTTRCLRSSMRNDRRDRLLSTA